jgi:hypothetical protein
MSNRLIVKFESREQTSPIELSIFLQLYVSTYRALNYIEGNKNITEEDFILPEGGLLSRLSVKEIQNSLSDDHFLNDPNIIEINQQSPIEITFAGGVGLLFIAAALSGGRQVIKFGPLSLEFNLTSLGESIVNLRRALSINESLRTGHGFKGTRIKLNQVEFDYLNKPANMNGGFQRFLRELQIRINKQTKVLELSNKDVEQILRYKQNPAKGGFQLRFNKIFKRHFP